jgi:PAS domain S-box-containing protein
MGIEESDARQTGSLAPFAHTAAIPRPTLDLIHPRRVEDADVALLSPSETTASYREEISRQPDKHLITTYDHAGIGIVEVDAAGIILRINAQLGAITGYSSEELVGRSIFEETFVDDVEPDRAQFHCQVAGEIDRYMIEKRIWRRDGTYLWASITSSSVRDAAGRFLYAVRVQHDITDRKRVEEALARRVDEQAALHELTERLRAARSLEDIYEPALDAICRALRCRRAAILLRDSVDVMRFVSWRGLSDDYRRVVEGHSPWTRDCADPQPISLDDVAHADLPEALRRHVQAEGIGALAFIPLQDDGRLLGKFMVYYDVPHVFNDAELDLAVTIARQLGFGVERLRADRAARLLVSIVESSDDAIISKDLSGIVTTWNRGAERLFGYTAEEIIGKPITLLIPADRLDEEPEIIARIRRGERVDHYETVRRRKDGSMIDISLTVSPMNDAKGKIVGASKIARDISERKEAEAQQTVLLAELNHRVKNNMQMLQSLLHASARQAQGAEARKILAEASGRIAAVAAGQQVLYRALSGTHFGAREFLETVCQTAKQSLPENVEIICEHMTGELANDAAIPLSLILNELLTNAVKHGTNGSAVCTIRVGLTRESDSFLLYVEDDGPGFDWDSVRNRSTGLRLVQGLARQLRGHFDVTRNPATRCTLQFC